MCEPGGSKNIHNPTAKNGIISKGFLQQKWGGMLFFDPRNLSLWTRQVMTDDKRQVQPINAEWRSVRGGGDANWVRVSGPCPIWVQSSTVHRAERDVV